LKNIVVLLFCLGLIVRLDLRSALAFEYGEAGHPKNNEVHISKVAIVMPVGRVLLARKGSEYFAIKFIEFWTGKTKEDLYASYELYYNKSADGNFSSKNIVVKKGELSFPKPRGIGRFAFSFSHREIKCGDIILEWSGEGSVHFYNENQEQGDYGVELAPTKWSNISEVDIHDKRLKWYRYDENRKRVNIPIDKLW
jgi:hypothetical protein